MQIRLFPLGRGYVAGGKEVPLSEVHMSRSRNSPLEDDGKDGNGSNYQEGQTPERWAHDQWQPVLHHLRALPWQGRHTYMHTDAEDRNCADFLFCSLRSHPQFHPFQPFAPQSQCFFSAFFPTSEKSLLPLNLFSLPLAHYQLTRHLSTRPALHLGCNPTASC